jgi:hypothetical protein
MQGSALPRRQFLGRAGILAVAAATKPASANEGFSTAAASGDTPSPAASQAHDRVALLCMLRGTTARG